MPIGTMNLTLNNSTLRRVDVATGKILSLGGASWLAAAETIQTRAVRTEAGAR